MTQAITINLSEELYKQLQRLAEISQESPEVIIENSLTHSLPPLLDEIPPEYQVEVYPLLQMTSAELKEEAARVFPKDDWATYESLLDKKKDAALTTDEQIKLNTLRRKANVLTFRKGYATILLKRYGYTTPTLQELE